MAYLNNEGLQHVWDKVAKGLKGKANKVHKHDIAEVKGLTVATSSSDGLMAAADKNKLDGLPSEVPRTFYITVKQTNDMDVTLEDFIRAYERGDDIKVIGPNYNNLFQTGTTAEYDTRSLSVHTTEEGTVFVYGLFVLSGVIGGSTLRSVVNKIEISNNGTNQLSVECITYVNSIPSFGDLDDIEALVNDKADKSVATTSKEGLMSASDKMKLDGIPADPAKAFYMTVTQTGADSYSVDKTGQEILDAYDAGCVLIADYGYEGYHYCMSKYTETQGNGADVVINSSTIRFFASNAEYNSVITIYIQLGKYGPNDINNIRVEYYKSTMLYDHLGNSSNPHNVTLTQLGVNATADELNYVDGVTSNIQTQLNAKAGTSVATTSNSGLMSAADKTKLDRIKNGVLIITVTGNDDGTYSSDYTFDEITAAYNSGMTLVVKYTNLIYTLFMGSAGAFQFANVQIVNGKSITERRIIINETGIVVRGFVGINSLKNPNALTFTGATSATYDGSAALSVEIPAGLPTVTTSNDGAFLRVVNGAWAAVQLPNVEEGEF